MAFSKRLIKAEVQEWRKYYIPYKKIKNHLKQLHKKNKYTNQTIKNAYLSAIKKEEQLVCLFFTDVHATLRSKLSDVRNTFGKKALLVYYGRLQKLSSFLLVNQAILKRLLRKYEKYYSTSLDVGPSSSCSSCSFLLFDQKLNDGLVDLMKVVEYTYTTKYTNNNNNRQALIDLCSNGSNNNNNNNNNNANANNSTQAITEKKPKIPPTLLTGFFLGISAYMMCHTFPLGDERAINLLSPILLWNMFSIVGWIIKQVHNHKTLLKSNGTIASIALFIFFAMQNLLESPLKEGDSFFFLLLPTIAMFIFQSIAADDDLSIPITLQKVFCPFLSDCRSSATKRRECFNVFFAAEQMTSLVALFKEFGLFFAFFSAFNSKNCSITASLLPYAIRIVHCFHSLSVSYLRKTEIKERHTENMDSFLIIIKYLLSMISELFVVVDDDADYILPVKACEVVFSCFTDVFVDWKIRGPRFLFVKNGVHLTDCSTSTFSPATYRAIIAANLFLRALPLFARKCKILIVLCELVRRSLWNVVVLELECCVDDVIVDDNDNGNVDYFVIDFDDDNDDEFNSFSNDEMSEQQQSSSSSEGSNFEGQLSTLLTAYDDDDEHVKHSFSLEISPPPSPILSSSGWMSPRLSTSTSTSTSNRERSKTT